ncbi:MAG: hypothetical protein NVSMB43_16350 [Pseudarthrobacter sp.]
MAPADFTTGARPVKAARGTEITAKSWQTEAPLRMLMNNLDPEVADTPRRHGRGLRRHRPRRPLLGGIRRHHPHFGNLGKGRDPPGPVG